MYELIVMGFFIVFPIIALGIGLYSLGHMKAKRYNNSHYEN